MKPSIHSRLYIINLLIIMFGLVTISTNSFAAQSIRVGYFEKKPLIFTADDGRVQGFAVDALSEIAHQQDWQIAYVKGTLSQTLQRIKQGEIDLMLPFAYTESRDKFIDYAGEQLIDSWGAVYSSRKKPLQSIQNLEGKRIGHLQSTFLQTIFNDLLDDLSISSEYIGVSDYDEMFNGLVSGQYDAAIGDYLAIFDVKSELAKFRERWNQDFSSGVWAAEKSSEIIRYYFPFAGSRIMNLVPQPG